ncbi:MAG TPA: ABC transporter permease [Candidatus Dormibacteraeota bacterium]|nr:ABC transporter permease [Candidatus Dormibacteraeota bacterium]
MKGWRVGLRRFGRHRGGMAGGIIAALFVATALLAPWLAPHDPEAMQLGASLASPSRAHPFGTDSLGRDVLSQTIYGARVSLTIGFVSVGLALLGGVPLGALSGYAGGWLDRVAMRGVDVLVSFPTILLAIIVITIFGPGLVNAMIAIGIAQIPLYARLVRGAVLRVKALDYVAAARAVGSRDGRILWRHVLPNCLAPVLVQSTLFFATAILSAAYLGFLGMGAQPPTPEWGTMLSKARDFLRVAPHVSVFPGLTIMLTVLGLNLLGDGLRDVLDPRAGPA